MNNPYRLDSAIKPSFYKIALTPNLKKFTFSGSESIEIRASKSFSAITLHALEIKITKARLRSAPAVAARKISYDGKLETATLSFGKNLKAGHYTLELEFTGLINDKLHGFYRTCYEIRGKKQWGAATQFEATDARRAFPCWDEPDAKARFALTLRVPKALTALSNMPVSKQRSLSGVLKEITYKPSVVMPTYLLAWVIAKLEHVERKDKNRVPIRIWTTPGKKTQAQFALDVGCHALPYFSKWFSIPYALPKLDMVALPDFASGAMENWGLVTYRETALLVDPKQSSVQAKQRVAEVMPRELAHPWFGNLVTMEWWTDLWLNEGFASYMGPKAVNDQFPDWKIWNQYVAGEYLGALHEDALKHSHPIEIPVQNPNEIREIFDNITYSKGSAVNRMLEHYLTEPVFRKGLSVYLKRYAYKNARTGDLWAVLERVSGKPVKAIMASFTKQEGYPILTARKRSQGIELTQRRFLADGSRDKTRKHWSVPIVAEAEGQKKPFFGLLRGSKTTIKAPTQGWVKLNAGQSGFYRIAYSSDLQAPLARAIASRKLPALDCLGLIDDAFALAKAGEIKTPQALDLLAGCRGYTDYNLWLTLAGSISAVEHLIADEELRSRMHEFGQVFFSPIAENLGWEEKPSDDHLTAMLRSLVISRMGHFKDQNTIEEARRRFDQHLTKKNLAPSLRGVVYAIVAEHGKDSEYEKLLGIYKASGMQEERVRVLRALTFLAEPKLIKKALNLAMSEIVRKQDAYMILGGFGGNRKARDIAWNFIKENWKELTKRYASGGLNLMTRIAEGATSGFTTESELEEVRHYFKSHPVPGAERAMARSLETIAGTVNWIKRDIKNIERWLSA